MRVWLDDERPMPEGYDVHIKTAHEAIIALGTGQVTEISLDHDLGSPLPGQTGYYVAKWMEGAAHNGYLGRVKWAIHSANPPGRKNIEDALKKADEFWDRKETG